MKTYTINVPATFAFDVQAKTEEEALEAALEILTHVDPVTDYEAFNTAFQAPWVAPQRDVLGQFEIMATEVCPE